MKENSEKINIIGNIIYYIILAIMIVLIIIYRFDVWVKEPCFFGDEGSLIYNLQVKNFFQLFSGLELAQSSPLAFLLFNTIIYCLISILSF